MYEETQQKPHLAPAAPGRSPSRRFLHHSLPELCPFEADSSLHGLPKPESKRQKRNKGFLSSQISEYHGWTTALYCLNSVYKRIVMRDRHAAFLKENCLDFSIK